MPKTMTRALSVLDTKRKAVAALEEREAALEGRLKAYRLRRAGLVPMGIQNQAVVVHAAAGRMAEQPTAQTDAAYREATGRLASLEAEANTLKDRLIPEAEAELADVRDELNAAESVLSRAALQQDIRDRLFPVDQRFIDAMLAAEKALADCEAARQQIAKEHGWHDGLQKHALNGAIPRRFASFMSGYPFDRSYVLLGPLQHHVEKFGLDADDEEIQPVAKPGAPGSAFVRGVVISQDGADIVVDPGQHTGRITSAVPDAIMQGRGVTITEATEA